MSEGQAESRPRFYICPVCFQVAQTPQECHAHQMIACHADKLEDCRPIISADGTIKSRAPRWFLEEVARLRK